MDGGHGGRGRVIAQEQDLEFGGTSQGKEDHRLQVGVQEKGSGIEKGRRKVQGPVSSKGILAEEKGGL